MYELLKLYYMHVSITIVSLLLLKYYINARKVPFTEIEIIYTMNRKVM